MTEVVSVRFKNRGKSYYFDPLGHQVQVGQNVIVETSKGLEFGECTRGNFLVPEDSVVPPLRPVIRLATSADVETDQENKEKERKAHLICLEKIRDHELDMKLVDVEYNFEGSKILFFFTSDGRVDFRELVRDLASVFRTRIELRQIGVRDEAKMLGGLGICGKPFCCSQFLDEFQPVSIKMAKTQSLSLNPAKISGTCGRLMCCLKYEQDAYEELVKNAPKVDSYVETPDGNGTITELNLLRQKVKVRMETQGGDPVVAYFPLSDIQFIKTGKQRRAELSAAALLAQDSALPQGEKPQYRNLKQSLNGTAPRGENTPGNDAPKPRDNRPPAQRRPETRADAPPSQTPGPEEQKAEADGDKKFHRRRKKRPGKPGTGRPKQDGPPKE